MRGFNSLSIHGYAKYLVKSFTMYYNADCGRCSSIVYI